jgi:tetratricopeptide (TPR) repeat protein
MIKTAPVQLGVLCFLVMMSSPLTAAAAPTVDLSRAWFTPSLAVNQDEICGEILSATRTKFSSSSSWRHLEDEAFPRLTRIPGPFENSVPGDSVFQPDTDSRRFILSERGGHKLYIYFQDNNGCRGACDSQQVWVSEEPLPDDGSDWTAHSSQRRTTPAAEAWVIFKSDRGHYYLLGIVNGREEVYKVTTPKAWLLSCAVTLAPEHFTESERPSMKEAVRAIEALDDTVAAMAGGEGPCGNGASPIRLWRSDTRETLYQTLYRPWAIVSLSSDAPSENSYGNYSRIWPSLVDWSLGGPGEHRAISRFQTQLGQTTGTLAHFYRDNFGWSEKPATDMAHNALINAVSHDFGFYLYDTYADADLRQAILEHASMDTIRAIEVDVAGENREGSNSVLSIAVEYPEALTYLLAKGLNPNIGNGFGKTPLMYAAQFDQLESAKILLDAGADPNAGTFIPADTCSYALHTDNMSPLHYAVRYASASLVTLLLDRGALTFSSADDPAPNQYPVVWLDRYTDLNGAERNTRLSESDVAVLRKRLAVPDANERESIARAKVLAAEKDHSMGRFSAAFREFRDALRADPTNAKAISDLPIAALRAGNSGVALASADQAIAHSTTSPEKAAAWFNKALACKAITAERSINRLMMCNQDYMQMFVTSYDIDPTPTRAKAIRQLFDGNDDVCVLPTQGLRIKEYESFMQPWTLSKFAGGRLDNSQGHRAYILVQTPNPLPVDALSWVGAPGLARVLLRHGPRFRARRQNHFRLACVVDGGDFL